MNRRLVALVFVSLVALAAAAFILVRPAGQSGPASGLTTFGSYAELAAYLDRVNAQSSGYTRLDFGGDPGTAALEGGGDYSRTNVQVEGVDELDTVKTDGTVIYLATYANVSVVRASPPEAMTVVTRITTEDLGIEAGENTSIGIHGIFLDGTRLAVVSFLSEYTADPCGPDRECLGIYFAPTTILTYVSVFDVSDPAAPALGFTRGVSGFASASRLTSGTVYVVAADYIYKVAGVYRLPVECGPECSELAATDIAYDPASADATSFTNVLAVDLADGDHAVLSAVTGATSTVYMSRNALYLTFQEWRGESSAWSPWQSSTPYTAISKVVADGVSMEVVANGEVPGALWSQFAMDEHEGFLRVVVQVSQEKGTDVHVLGANLTAVGSLEDLAPGERVFATRFVGDALYLVTFRQVDPLFVIDLSTPDAPEVLGELTIPGFSTYLHPVDAGHILGLGAEGWSTMKVSMFDVTDPSNPTESFKYEVSNASWSSALYEHRAVLFDAARELLVIPVWEYAEGRMGGEAAYVFGVSTTDGIALRGTIGHDDGTGWASVYRSLYIGEVLYTVSYTVIMAHSLMDLGELGSLAYTM